MKDYKTMPEIIAETGYIRTYIYRLLDRGYIDRKYATNEKGTKIPMFKLVKQPPGTGKITPPEIDGYISQIKAIEMGLNTKKAKREKFGRFVYFKIKK